MSAIFDSTTDRITSAAPMGVNGAIAIALKPTWASNDGNDHVLFQSFFSAGNSFNIEHYSDNNLYDGWVIGGTDYRATTLSANYSWLANAWRWHIVDWDDTSNVTRRFLDATQIGSNSTLIAGAITGITLGNLVTPSLNLAARMGRVMIWSRTLTAPEIATIAAGGIPSDPTGRVSKYELVSDAQDSWGTNHGTATNVTFDATDNPPSSHVLQNPFAAGGYCGITKLQTKAGRLLQSQ